MPVINTRQVAEGAEARMRQLLRVSETGRPAAGLRRAAWDATSALRGHLPRIQAALGEPPRFRTGTLAPGDLARPVERDGLQVPRYPTCVDATILPREGARLVGRAEGAVGGALMFAGLASRFATDEARARGHRGARLVEFGMRGLGSAGTLRRFGMALADAALQVPDAPDVGLPQSFGFNYYPAAAAADAENVFAREAAAAISAARCLCPCPKREALFDAYRLLGHLEEINGLCIEGLVEAEAPDAFYGAADLARDCVRAALAGEPALRVLGVPVAPWPVRAPAQAETVPAAAPVPAM